MIKLIQHNGAAYVRYDELSFIQLIYGTVGKQTALRSVKTLGYVQLCQPCFKSMTFHDVPPLLMEDTSFSFGKMYVDIGFLGAESAKVIEVYKHATVRSCATGRVRIHRRDREHALPQPVEDR